MIRKYVYRRFSVLYFCQLVCYSGAFHSIMSRIVEQSNWLFLIMLFGLPERFQTVFVLIISKLSILITACLSDIVITSCLDICFLIKTAHILNFHIQFFYSLPRHFEYPIVDLNISSLLSEERHFSTELFIKIRNKAKFFGWSTRNISEH